MPKKPHTFDEKSGHIKCKKCRDYLKLNLLAKIPDAKFCHACFKENRTDRIVAKDKARKNIIT